MAEERAGLVKSPFTITENSDNITEQSQVINTTGTFFYLWRYNVPLGTAVEITPVNFFFIDLRDSSGTGGACGVPNVTLRVLKGNQNRAETREIWSGPDDLFSGNLYDEFQRPKFRVPVLFNASQQLIIQANLAATTASGVSPANSSFVIEAMQIYEEV